MATVAVSADDEGRTIEARPGDEIVLRLPENPTTGYRWELEPVRPPLELVDTPFQLDVDARIGGGGVREFRFRATGEGRMEVRLKHWQSWSGEGSVTRRLSFPVAVNP